MFLLIPCSELSAVLVQEGEQKNKPQTSWSSIVQLISDQCYAQSQNDWVVWLRGSLKECNPSLCVGHDYVDRSTHSGKDLSHELSMSASLCQQSSPQWQRGYTSPSFIHILVNTCYNSGLFQSIILHGGTPMPKRPQLWRLWWSHEFNHPPIK